jgi:acyl carrier protein
MKVLTMNRVSFSSGIGLEFAGYLAKKSHTRVYISGTRSPEEFRKSNSLPFDILSKIYYLRSDILDAEQINTTIDKIYSESGKLTGIFFAPGRISYGSFAHMDSEIAGNVLAPKILGLLNLSTALQGRETRFVCLISSISGIAPVFSKGMVAYSIGNAFLDAFAVMKQSRGHNWISINWSLWSKTGMARFVNSSGEIQPDSLHALDPGLACRLMDEIIQLKRANIIAMDPLDRQKFTFHYSNLAPEIQQKAETEKQPSGINIPNNDMIGYLRDKIIRAAELKTSEINDDESFQMIGIDSLAALDVIREIEEETGTGLNPTL